MSHCSRCTITCLQNGIVDFLKPNHRQEIVLKHLSIMLFSLAVLLFLQAAAGATEIEAGPVSGSWEVAGNPYNINGEIEIPVDSTLSVGPGVEIIFQGHYQLVVRGLLEANGSVEDPILFDAADSETGWRGIRFLNAQDSSHLAHCTIQHGRATGSDATDPDGWGGGILIDASNPLLTSCLIQNNWAQYFSGGICITNLSNPTLTDCMISNNISAGDGGGAGVRDDSAPLFSDCTIQNNNGGLGAGIIFWSAQGQLLNCNIFNNVSTTAGGGLYIDNSSPLLNGCNVVGNSAAPGSNGGGFWIGSNAAPLISDCYILSNQAGANGGAMRICQSSDPVVSDCIIRYNEALHGAGVSVSYCPRPLVTGCLINDNLAGGAGGGVYIGEAAGIELSFCEITSNTAQLSGGGIECNTGTNPWVLNCTVEANIAVDGSGGGINVHSAQAWIDNTIITHNLGDGIFYDGVGGSILEHCDLFGNDSLNFSGILPTGFGDLVSTNENGDSCDVYLNIFLNPLFENPGGGNYQLLEASPCIDAGDPDQPADPDGTVSDIGCYYYHQPEAVADRSLSLPPAIRLLQNFPNPFNPSTQINFTLVRSCDIRLSVYDVQGREVAQPAQGTFTAGSHSVMFDGSSLSSGVYFYRLQSGGQLLSGKMMLLR